MTWDAVVVGGGPAGSTAAWSLARRGARVLVLDAARFPRVKLCAGWVTRSVFAALELEPASYPRTIQPFSRATLELAGGSAETSWRATVGWGIVRREFDAWLLDRARAAGALVREGERVLEVEPHAEGVRIRGAAGTVDARLVVGAGGHGCPVARALGDVSDDEAVVVTQESETRVGEERLARVAPRPGVPELFPEPDFRGYAWYFAKRGFLNVGLGALDDGRGLRRRTQRFVAALRASGRLPAGLELEPFRGHAYAIRAAAPRRLASSRHLLAGDAGGLARSLSGEGIGPAVVSGRLAADAALESLAGRADAAERYVAAVAGGVGGGPPGWLSRIADRAPRAVVEAAGRLVCRAGWPRRRLVFEGAFGMG